MSSGNGLLRLGSHCGQHPVNTSAEIDCWRPTEFRAGFGDVQHHPVSQGVAKTAVSLNFDALALAVFKSANNIEHGMADTTADVKHAEGLTGNGCKHRNLADIF